MLEYLCKITGVENWPKQVQTKIYPSEQLIYVTINFPGFLDVAKQIVESSSPLQHDHGILNITATVTSMVLSKDRS